MQIFNTKNLDTFAFNWQNVFTGRMPIPFGLLIALCEILMGRGQP